MIRLATFIAILLLPSVALAADATADVSSGGASSIVGVVGITLGIVLAAGRLLRVTQPALDAMLPTRWQWLPDTLLVALGGAAAALPLVTDWVGFAEVVLGAVTIVALAAMRGHQP